MTGDNAATGVLVFVFVFLCFAIGGVSGPLALFVAAGAGTLAAYCARVFEGSAS